MAAGSCGREGGRSPKPPRNLQVLLLRMSKDVSARSPKPELVAVFLWVSQWKLYLLTGLFGHVFSWNGNMKVVLKVGAVQLRA
ncbi:hypothetical protein AV530_015146 [Patagioenas fasciata monilis]|uniref:Uncharacterized protein n=1 Tax=Patagioenas fasciata monilis TaxID=372326 RepID=A0A1V4K1A5_PATFA|nr:hypothetical protein AV530_015146 [Patagioenas fasciata monilis]